MHCKTEVQGECLILFSSVQHICMYETILNVCAYVCVCLKVGNMKKDSVALWYKDGREIKASEKLDFSEGVLSLEITKVRTFLENLFVDIFYVLNRNHAVFTKL